jgi:uncharacterized protein
VPVRAIQITLYASFSHSLKDKRQILRSLIDRIRHRFNVSIAETDAMDLHQKLVLGIACISNSDSHAGATIDAVVRFIENFADDEGIDIIEIDVLSG